MVLDIVSTTEEVYTRKLEQIILEIKNQISQQVQKMFMIFMIIVVLSIIVFLLKLALKKYFSQNEIYYMTNKIINFTLVFLIVMVLLFSYIDNVSYLITILGFASAGIAIALKDAGGTIREYLYPSKSGSPIAAVALNIEDTSTTNGVWHAHNPVSAGIYPTTTYSSFTAGYTGGLDAIVQCGPTYYIFLSRSGSTCYAKLGTLNLSTKAMTFGSSITLSGSVGTWAYNGGYGESNGVDKGILAEYWGSNPGGGLS